MQIRNNIISINDKTMEASYLNIGQYLIDTERLEYISYKPVTPIIENILNNYGYSFNDLTKLEITSENVLSFLKAENFNSIAIWSDIVYTWLKVSNINIDRNLFKKIFKINIKTKFFRIDSGNTKMGKKFLNLFVDDLIKEDRIDILNRYEIEELEKYDIPQNIMDILYFNKDRMDKIIDRFEYVLLEITKRNIYISNKIFHKENYNDPRIQRLVTFKDIIKNIESGSIETMESLLDTIFLFNNYDELTEKILIKAIIFNYLRIMNKVNNYMSLKDFIWTERFKEIRNEAIIEYIEYKPRVYEVYFNDEFGSKISYLFQGKIECKDFMLSIPNKTNNKKLKKILMKNLL